MRSHGLLGKEKNAHEVGEGMDLAEVRERSGGYEQKTFMKF